MPAIIYLMLTVYQALAQTLLWTDSWRKKPAQGRRSELPGALGAKLLWGPWKDPRAASKLPGLPDSRWSPVWGHPQPMGSISFCSAGVRAASVSTSWGSPGLWGYFDLGSRGPRSSVCPLVCPISAWSPGFLSFWQCDEMGQTDSLDMQDLEFYIRF